MIRRTEMKRKSAWIVQGDASLDVEVFSCTSDEEMCCGCYGCTQILTRGFVAVVIAVDMTVIGGLPKNRCYFSFKPQEKITCKCGHPHPAVALFASHEDAERAYDAYLDRPRQDWVSDLIANHLPVLPFDFYQMFEEVLTERLASRH